METILFYIKRLDQTTGHRIVDHSLNFIQKNINKEKKLKTIYKKNLTKKLKPQVKMKKIKIKNNNKKKKFKKGLVFNTLNLFF